jgi:hypothetical protein
MEPSPEGRFAAIAETELGRRGVTTGPGRGVSASGVGRPFDGKGRPMMEWISVPAKAGRRWPSLVEEARGFVAKGDRKPGRASTADRLTACGRT